MSFNNIYLRGAYKSKFKEDTKQAQATFKLNLHWQRSISQSKKCLFTELFWSAFFPHFPAFELNTERYPTAQKIKFSIKDFFSKCDQIRKKGIWHFLWMGGGKKAPVRKICHTYPWTLAQLYLT